MKIGEVKLSSSSLALLVIQLALVSSVAAKYLYQRQSCPQVWTRAVAFDPVSPMRGRYLSLQLVVDGCQSTLPSAKQAAFGRNVDGSANQSPFAVAAGQPVSFPAKLAVNNNRLIAVRIPATDGPPKGEIVSAFPGQRCDAMRLADLVNFYIAEHAASPLPLKPGTELWIEITIPAHGPPRPLQLALKQGRAWKPFAFH
ncbi:MAG TPA: hypothetical protein VGG85_06450 [Terracidiphilus sp.]|jgi:hypothetical protein